MNIVMKKLNEAKEQVAEESRKRAVARRMARTLRDPARRDQDCIAGLRRFADRFKTCGDLSFGERIHKATDELQSLLDRESTELESANRPVPPFVADAQREAVRELLKKLPSCFACEQDAAEFVKPLQFSEARLNESRERDERRSHAKKATKLRREFTQKLEYTASMAVGEEWANKAIDKLLAIS